MSYKQDRDADDQHSDEIVSGTSSQYELAVASTITRNKNETVNSTKFYGGVAVRNSIEANEIPSSFIAKTYQMINNSDDNVLAWTSAGDKFIVKDQLRLASECFPLYFTHTNFTSFTRQLNFYRFRKIFSFTKTDPGSDIVATDDKNLIFYHEKFHRDHPEWLSDIKRTSKAGQSGAEQEQIIEDLQNQVTNLERRLEALTAQLHTGLETIVAKFDRQIADLQRRHAIEDSIPSSDDFNRRFAALVNELMATSDNDGDFEEAEE